MPDNEIAQRLIHNLDESLRQVTRACTMLTDVEQASPFPGPDALEELLKNLDSLNAAGLTLATTRESLIDDLLQGDERSAASVLKRLPSDYRQRGARLFDDLRVGLADLQRGRDRVWAMLRARACVVEATLCVLTGGGTRLYAQTGEASLSPGKPFLQRSC